jgi:solute carrier family 8 (sodium/calcium exchanger)
MAVHGLPAGNVLLSASILYAGASPAQTLRVLDFFSVASIKPRTFFRHQKKILLPAITNVWAKEKEQFLECAKKRGTPLVLGGDGRADSPGHSAKFGSYSLMDLEQGKVIDVQLVQVYAFLYNFEHYTCI